ncbi:PDZ domain-containing protein [Opitutales bacterium]|nr:PDZ domain-containing protein [Opitutales bacterium]
MKFSIFLFTIGILFNLSLVAKNKDSDDRTTAYLGIYATKVNPNVSHQLKLTENLYLNVELVAKNSPAEKAGIQKFDLLLQLNDQILVNQEQLKYLVRSKMPTDEVILTLLRQGEKQKITVKLGETNLIEEDPLRNSGLSNRLPQYDPFGMDSFLHDPQNLQDLIERHSRQPFLHFNQNRGRHKKILPPNQWDDEPLHPKANTESFSSQTSQIQVMITDEEGTLEWTEKDGQKSLRATDSHGKVLFDGPIDTEDERNALPDEINERLNELEKNMVVR